MPLSIFWSLDLKDLLKPTNITLQLADRSLTYPKGIIKDVLIKFGKFIIPADFVVLDIEEDKNVPIILGRPFLAIGDAIIEVQKRILTLRVDEEEFKFNIFRSMKYPKKADSCWRENTHSIIISSALSVEREEKPLRVLMNFKGG